MTRAAPGISPRTMERDIQRATRFLRTLSMSPAIRAIMETTGYDEVEHDTGWELLLFLLGYHRPLPALVEPGNEQREAIAELDQWDGPRFHRARVALERLHPKQAEYIFAGLKAGTGATAITTVNIFLDRVAALRDGTNPRREELREADKAAVATLEKRRIIDPETETHLRSLLQTAKRLPGGPECLPDTTIDGAYLAKAVELHDWLRDWRETARMVMRRGDYARRLGLTTKRARDEPEGNES